MTQKLFEYEYRPGEELVLRFRSPSGRLLPPEVRNHWLEAQKELLLALRSLVDAAIALVEERESAQSRRQEIRVE